jgi:hypothetical protein
MTVRELRDRLLDLPLEAEVDVMLETKDCQYQGPLQDIALSKRRDHEKVILIFEHPEYARC